MRFTKDGVLLADVPDSGITRKNPDARSGNPNHDVRSGKFGSGGGQKKSQVQTPANADPLEYRRMIDAVREAARQYDLPDEANMQEFLAGRAKSPDQVDIAAFLTAVKEQQKADVVDILDAALRTGKGKPKVRLTAPQGVVKKILGGLDGTSVAEIMHRLEAMGHDKAEVDRFFDGRSEVSDEATEQAKAKRDEVAASASTDRWFSDPITVMVETDPQPEENFYESPQFVEFVERVLPKIPQPIINVTPEIHLSTPRTKKIPVRDSNGLIVEVQEEAITE